MPEWMLVNPSPLSTPAMGLAKAGCRHGLLEEITTPQAHTGEEPAHGQTVGANLGAT